MLVLVLVLILVFFRRDRERIWPRSLITPLMEGCSSHAYDRVIDYTMSTSLPYEGLVLLNGLNAGAETRLPRRLRISTYLT